MEKAFKNLEGTIYECNEYLKQMVYDELDKLPMQQYPQTEDEAYRFIMRVLH